MTAVKKNLINKIIVDHKTDLVNYPYSILLEIRELDPRSKRSGKKTRVDNVYNNWIRKDCI